MKRGSTPTNTFTLPFAPPYGSEILIVYAQGEDHKESILFEKTAKDCAIDGNVVSVRLSADETLRFDCSPHYHNGKYEPYPVKIQLGIKYPNDTGADILWSDIIETPPERCLKGNGGF